MSIVRDAIPREPSIGDGVQPVDLKPPSNLLGLAARSWEWVEFWVISRIVIFSSIILIGTLVQVEDQPWDASSGWIAHRFASFDSGHFLRTAEEGYFTETRRCCSQAFLPGYPLSIRALSPLVGGHEIWAALLITLIAGVVAAALLRKLATEQAGPVAGKIAMVALALNPLSVFMTVVYSEALFLALALGAWLMGQRGRWWWAGALAAGATGVRINGVFLVTALAVMFLLQLRRQQPGVRWYDGAALAMPVVVLASYFTWLQSQTGSWTEWHDAESLGWDRKLAAPWTGLTNGYTNLFSGQGTHISFSAGAELFAVLFGVAVTVWLVLAKRWPEAVYMGLNMTVLVCSTTLVSSARYSLIWFPMYILLAEKLASPGRRWVRVLLATAAIPMLAYGTAAWTLRAWIG